MYSLLDSFRLGLLRVLGVGLNFLFLNWRSSPLVNVREDHLAAHALVLTRGHHGAALIALDHRFVTRCTTSVAFVDFGHRPGKYDFCGFENGSGSLHFNALRPNAPTTGCGAANPQNLCVDLGITPGHTGQTRMPIGPG